MHTQNRLLDMQRVYAGYGEAEVLFDVSLTIERGECLALLGRNGMGKTTLVRVLMGQIAISDGQLIRMHNPHPLPAEAIARLGFGLVPEGRQVFPSLTVGEHLTAFWHQSANPMGEGWTPERVMTFLPGLAKRRHHRGNALSGGEQQMLAIGRALVTNPSLLILDEASEGLSPLMRDALWQCLAELKKTGVAILIVDQSTPALSALADRIAIMQKGRLVWQGKPTAMTEAIAKRYLGIGVTSPSANDQ